MGTIWKKEENKEEEEERKNTRKRLTLTGLRVDSYNVEAHNRPKFWHFKAKCLFQGWARQFVAETSANPNRMPSLLSSRRP
jgi:hypothetical protein